jgi:tetratricopeptide (TPR) repeat protein
LRVTTLRKLLIVPVIALVAYAAAAVPPPTLEKAVIAQRALAEKQPSAKVWNDLGNLLQLAGHDAEAQDAYDRALELDSKLVSAHYNAGLLARSAGDEGKALDHFHQVVELDPRSGWGWFQIGSLEEARGAEGTAIEAYARAYALDPRLSFGDVNPQVIDSKLTMQALLAASGERPPAAEAARAYEDPRHIAKLLLPTLPAASNAPAPSSAPTATARRPSVPVPPSPAAEAAAAAGSNKVLRPQDLPARQAGGVTNPRPVPQPGDIGANPGDPGYSDLLRQQLELQQQQQQELESGEGAPPDAGAGVYVPGVQSSGQLEQELQDLPTVS